MEMKYKDADWLYEKYWNENKSTNEIASECGTNHAVILVWMEKFNIKRRGLSEAQKICDLKNDQLYRNKKWLEQQYWKLEKSSTKIGKECGCGARTVTSWMERHNISRRTKSQALKGDKNPMHSRRGLSNPFYGKKHTQEMKQKISQLNKGRIPANKGIPQSEDAKRKMSKNHADYRGEKHPRYGKKYPEAGKKVRGEKNPNWRGGHYPYYGPNWILQRNKVLLRDNNTCQRCKKHGNEVHHKIAMREYLLLILNQYSFTDGIGFKILKFVPYELLIPNLIFEEANRSENLITFCKPCHKESENPNKNLMVK